MTDDVRYALTVGVLPARALKVLTLSGREAISRLYKFDLLVASSLPEAALTAVALGTSARLALQVGGITRVVHGIVSRVRQRGWQGGDGSSRAGAHTYELCVVPRAWLLRKRKGSFIFQDARIDEVVDRIAAPMRVATRWDLGTPLPARPYCTQFEETDYGFIRRLCAENGILFYFDQGNALNQLLEEALAAVAEGLGPLPLDAFGDLARLLPSAPILETGEVMVFTDQPLYPALGHAPVPPSLEVRRHAGAITGGEESTVADVSVVHRVVSSGAIYREYDPSRPLAELETTTAGVTAAATVLPTMPGMPLPEGFGISAPPVPGAAGMAPPPIPAPPIPIPAIPTLPIPLPGMPLLGANEIEALHIYEHDGRDHSPDWERTQAEPSLILRQHRRRRVTLDARSHVVHIQAGRSFRLEGSRIDEANRTYAVVEVTHEGRATFHESDEKAAYANRFSAVPSDVAFIPRRPRRRSVQVCMTALVVGPTGEEIHVNERGEIRVKLYWDRRPDRETPTCWIRTMHALAGTAWGTQFIPRVGMEAVVVFEGGDPDRPLVLGTVYNGILPPPFALPEHKTRSGIRTQSSPRAVGHNELSFEDAAQREQVYLRAQRDFDSLVQRDRTALVQHQDHEKVLDDQYLEVGGKQHIHVVGDRDAHLESDDVLHVEGARHVQVDHLQEERYGTRSVSVATDDRLAIGGDLDRQVTGNVALVTKGNATALVGTNEAPRSLAAVVTGGADVQADGAITLSSDREVVLRCGQSFLRVSAERIEIVSDEIQVRGKDASLVLADGELRSRAKSLWQATSDDALLLRSSGAGIGLQSEAKVDGSKVLLNSPGSATDTATVDDPEPLKLEVVDQDGAPAAYQRYRIALDAGGEVTGFLDENGKAEVAIEGGGRVTFPDLVEVEPS